MNNRSKKIIASSLLIIPLLVAIIPHPASASWYSAALNVTLWEVTALISELILAIMGSLVTITAALLNATMTATLNMSQIVDNTPAVALAWTTIRDFGSVFIIFMLLDASIRIILGLGSSAGKLIKNIVIAGLLINFSLFFTKLAVDASNIISLSFYSAIAPTGLGQGGKTVNSSNSAAGAVVGMVSQAFNDGGLGNVFMQNLDLQSVAAASTTVGTLKGDPNWNLTLANIGASVLMSFAAVSFFVASLAFSIRMGVLILLMAFSPIFFIAMIFPDLEQYSKQWSKMLYSMCIFMPVYMLIMYVAMSVLSDPHFFCFAQLGASAACPAPATAATGLTNNAVVNTLIGPSLIGIVLQYIIAIFLINAPLVAAISIASEGASFLSTLMKKASKWGQGAITNSAKWSVKTGWRETGGRAANALAKNEGFRNLAAKSSIADYLHRGTQGIAADYNETSEKRAEKQDKRRKELGFDETRMAASQDRISRLNAIIADRKVKGKDTTAFETARSKERDNSINIETERAKSFADRTSADDKSLKGMGGLWNRLTRSNPVASAKSKIFVHEKEMKRAKEGIDDLKKDLRDVQKSINASGVTSPNPRGGPPLPGTVGQNDDMQRLLRDISKSEKTIRDHEIAIRNLNLEAKKTN